MLITIVTSSDVAAVLSPLSSPDLVYSHLSSDYPDHILKIGVPALNLRLEGINSTSITTTGFLADYPSAVKVYDIAI